ncbi:hypothetical protein BRD56_02475 [Thermoplasmatales archaeon SW_10_69_26]|nr:MAG: hypothetical protein BRD56_02475 [Thermoplasmatales archaeon SW_10_69_26]
MSPNLRHRSWSLIASLLLVTAGLAGCVQEAEASTGEVYVKDDVTDEAEAVHVEFTKAEILPADSNEWVTVYEGDKEIELLSLSDADAREQLADFEIEPGEYDRLRIHVANVTVDHENGTSEELVVHGNMVTVAEDISYEPGEDVSVLLDFDLDESINTTRGEYTPVVGDLQRSDVDQDEDGEADLDDTDDDGDDTPDHVDDDRDGDGQPDLPAQAQSYDKRGLKGVCTAWENNDQGRENGTVEENATAFQWLQNRSAEAGQSVDVYCEETTSQGAPDEIGITKDELPERAQQALGDRHLGPPEDRRGHGDDRSQDRGDGDREADRGGDRDRRDGNQTRSDEQEDRQQSEDEQRSDEQETNRSAEQQP